MPVRLLSFLWTRVLVELLVLVILLLTTFQGTHASPTLQTTEIPVDGAPSTSISCRLCDRLKNYLVSTKLIQVNGPPLPGANVEIVARGELLGREWVEKGATLDLSVFMGPMLVLKKQYDLCRMSAEHGSPCPILPGPDQKLHLAIPIPFYAPAFKYNYVTKAYNSDGSEILCLKGMIKVES